MADARRDANQVTALVAVSSVDGFTIVPLWADPSSHRLLVDAGSSTGSGFQLPSAGLVNGTNKVFAWTTAPNAICVDGLTLAITSQDASLSVNWTGTTTTTLTIAPNSSCFAVA